MPRCTVSKQNIKSVDTFPIYRIISRGRSSSRWKILKYVLEKSFIRCELRSIGTEISGYSNEPSAIINQSFRFLNCCELVKENNISGLWLSVDFPVDWLVCKFVGRFVGWLAG